MPAAVSAVSALAGARNVYCFGAGVPRSVMAVSRFTIAMSADRNTGAIPLRTVAGFAASATPIGPSKCTSPPNANVTGPSARVVVVVAGGAVVVVARADVVVVARDAPELRLLDELHAAAAATSAAPTTAPRRARLIGHVRAARSLTVARSDD